MAGSILVLQLTWLFANVLNVVEHDQSGGLGIERDAGRGLGSAGICKVVIWPELARLVLQMLRRKAQGRDRS